MPLHAGPPVGDDVDNEYRLKAAFLYRFPEFVEWPAAALDGRSTVDLCIHAPNPFGDVLDQLAAGESLRGRRLAVRHVDGDRLAGCHLLFLPRQLASHAAILRRVQSLPVLTVSDAPDFLDRGGVIQLYLVNDRVRFSISTAAANRAKLRVSTQLLRLALSVRGDGS